MFATLSLDVALLAALRCVLRIAATLCNTLKP
jgi:hypothetical protein